MTGRDLNRAALSVLLSISIVVGCRALALAAVPATAPANPAFVMPDQQKEEALPKGDAARGEDIVNSSCSFCHSLTRGGGDSAGPALFGVVGRPVASVASYNYSGALKQHAAQTWTPRLLSDWLKAPSHFAPGTRMSLAGISDPGQRADIIAFLQTLHEQPSPAEHAP